MALALRRAGLEVLPGNIPGGVQEAISADHRARIFLTPAELGLVRVVAFKLVANAASVEQAYREFDARYLAAGWSKATVTATDITYTRGGRRVDVGRQFECDPDEVGDNFHLVVEARSRVAGWRGFLYWK